MMQFKTPTSFAVVGGTMSGKTHFVWNLLKHGRELFDVPPKKIVYCYLEDQGVVEDMESTLPNFSTYRGLPSREELREWSTDSPHTVVVLDDMIYLVTKSADALHLFQTMVSRANVTAFLLSQNLYHPGVYAKRILLICQHVVLFKSSDHYLRKSSVYWAIQVLDGCLRQTRAAPLRIHFSRFNQSLSGRETTAHQHLTGRRRYHYFPAPINLLPGFHYFTMSQRTKQHGLFLKFLYEANAQQKKRTCENGHGGAIKNLSRNCHESIPGSSSCDALLSNKTESPQVSSSVSCRP